jgi:lantibiotic biosynthesis protein
MNDENWKPLLSGDDERTAQEVIAAIAEELPTAKPVNPYDKSGQVPDRDGAGLAGGNSGFALWNTYLAQTTGEERWAELAEKELDEAVEELATYPMGASLYGGFSGVAWVTEHLQGRLFETEEGEDPNEEIDNALAELLTRPWNDTYDLIGGLVGFSAYAIERAHRPSAAVVLERTVDQYARLAEHQEDGKITWFTPPEQLPPHQLEVSPNGYYNLGVAHGMPGVIAALAGTWAAGVAREKVEPLLEGGVRWLLANQLPEGFNSRFAYSVSPGAEPSPSRLAWCYGDLGVSAALLYAARAAGRDDWAQAAIEVGLGCAARDRSTGGAQDAGVCHGAMGIAHLFNRLWQGTRDERFAEAARVWFREGFALRKPGVGIGGYQSWFGGFNDGPGWVDSKGLLEGAAGIGLTLLAATSSIAPDWDHMLLVKVPAIPA